MEKNYGQRCLYSTFIMKLYVNGLINSINISPFVQVFNLYSNFESLVIVVTLSINTSVSKIKKQSVPRENKK